MVNGSMIASAAVDGKGDTSVTKTRAILTSAAGNTSSKNFVHRFRGASRHGQSGTGWRSSLSGHDRRRVLYWGGSDTRQQRRTASISTTSGPFPRRNGTGCADNLRTVLCWNIRAACGRPEEQLQQFRRVGEKPIRRLHLVAGRRPFTKQHQHRAPSLKGSYPAGWARASCTLRSFGSRRRPPLTISADRYVEISDRNAVEEIADSGRRAGMLTAASAVDAVKGRRGPSAWLGQAGWPGLWHAGAGGGRQAGRQAGV